MMRFLAFFIISPTFITYYILPFFSTLDSIKINFFISVHFDDNNECRKNRIHGLMVIEAVNETPKKIIGGDNMKTNTLDTKIQAGKFLTSLLESDIAKERLELKKNDKIELTATNNTPYIFVIVAGVAGIFSNKNVAIDFAGEGDLLDYNVYSSQLFGKALTDELTVWRFAQSDVFNKIAENAEIQLQHYHMLQTIQRRLEKKQIQATLDTKNMIAAFIHTLATRYNPKADDQGMIELPRYFSRKMIANYAGVSLSTLTAHLQQLMEEGRIIFNARVLLIGEENEA